MDSGQVVTSGKVRVKELDEQSVRVISGLSRFALTSGVLPTACTCINHSWQNTAFVCSTDVVRQHIKRNIIEDIKSLPTWLNLNIREFSRFHISVNSSGVIINIFLVLSARELKGLTFKNLFVVGSEKHADKIREDILKTLNRTIDIIGLVKD